MKIKLKVTIPEQKLRFLGLRAKQMILKRTEEGIAADGQPLPDYSQNWFAMPSGAIPKTRLENLEKADSSKLQYFRTKKGKLWMLVQGYVHFKKHVWPEHYSHKLKASGEMLGSMVVSTVNSRERSFTVGFARPEMAERASYLADRGWHFLGLSENEKQKILSEAINFMEIE